MQKGIEFHKRAGRKMRMQNSIKGVHKDGFRKRGPAQIISSLGYYIKGKIDVSNRLINDK